MAGLIEDPFYADNALIPGELVFVNEGLKAIKLKYTVIALSSVLTNYSHYINKYKELMAKTDILRTEGF